ncbi:MAG TPA: bifunctional precorrin-2 dehydrogenase/sirohydrochlorin ferrochelatase [Bacteroidales bacterium]|nr:bifunctional precorrin-2 dehydrogenase/sirohydrochlorin ferrochelatase [Bacteroidales bacterium]
MPLAIDVKGKKILLVGGGHIAFHKIESLQQYADNIQVIALEVSEKIKSAGVTYQEKPYEPSDLEGSVLVYACTNIPELNEKVLNDAKKHGILVNVVDNPSRCDFVSPAIYRKDYMSVAVTSNAQDVYESIELRNRIKNFLEDDYTPKS